MTATELSAAAHRVTRRAAVVLLAAVVLALLLHPLVISLSARGHCAYVQQHTGLTHPTDPGIEQVGGAQAVVGFALWRHVLRDRVELGWPYDRETGCPVWAP